MIMKSPLEQLVQIKLGLVDLINEAELLAKLEKSYKSQTPLKIKFGADPTRPDLHLGHTVVLNKLRQFQDLGHRVQFIIGDFTALIGDPSGRNETRPPLSADEIQINAKSYAEQVYKVLDKDKMDLYYNSSWMKNLTPADFIKLTAQYTVARILERDDFTKRFKANIPISLHELLYPLCQGYDSVYLKSDVELGGTDQKFNLLVGRELQKAYGDGSGNTDVGQKQQQQCVLTLPLLEGIDGVQKMSKSYDNYISVAESPKDMFGKTMRISDELMIRWYELLTSISPQELTLMKENLKSGKEHPRDVKVNLAKFIVKRFYSEEVAQSAEEEFHRIFANKGLPNEIPEYRIKATSGIWIGQIIVESGLATSNGEARRLIQGRGVEVDQVKIEDEKLKIELKVGQNFLLKVGKKKFLKVIVE